MRNKTLKDDFNNDLSIEEQLLRDIERLDQNHFKQTLKLLDDVSLLEYLAFLAENKGPRNNYVASIKTEVLLRIK